MLIQIFRHQSRELRHYSNLRRLQRQHTCIHIYILSLLRCVRCVEIPRARGTLECARLLINIGRDESILTPQRTSREESSSRAAENAKKQQDSLIRVVNLAREWAAAVARAPCLVLIYLLRQERAAKLFLADLSTFQERPPRMQICAGWTTLAQPTTMTITITVEKGALKAVFSKYSHSKFWNSPASKVYLYNWE